MISTTEMFPLAQVRQAPRDLQGPTGLARSLKSPGKSASRKVKHSTGGWVDSPRIEARACLAQRR